MKADIARIVDDPILERLDEQVRAEEALIAAAGLETNRSGATAALDHDPAPYDLAAEAPRALSLPKLLELTGAKMPDGVAATIGNYRPIVLLHGLTPFHRQGARPREIWGMGYQATLLKCDDARTVAYEPGNNTIKVADVNQSLAFDVAIDGRIEAADQGAAGMPLLPGLTVSASTRQGFALSLHIEWAAVEVQAGPIGAGGVRWNLYRQQQRLDRHCRFIQTALVPTAAKSLTIELRTWVRRRGGFFGVFGTREWSPPPQTFKLAIETTR
ncbi:hypothetical protein [Tahibacter sp.]|uniref:hypothetical protein n=1 Tax=Tahibacter sp. TaxID=2056211 RepID=UPI0028C45FBC|nr:hypothetical protein [Tahibacter sp.]